MDDVAVLVGDRVAAFELGILCQVFGLDRSDDGLPSYDFALCGVRPGPVPTTSGFDVTVPHDLDRAGSADLVCVPAWPGLADPLHPALGAALRAAVDRGATVLSVCTGAFALAAAGVLDGRRATTHWQFASRLARRHPRVHVDPAVLYVQDGPVLTSAGAAAGLDACLHLVRQVHGARTANALARRMVLPAHRAGGQAQYVETALPEVSAVPLAAVLDWAVTRLDEPLRVDDLAARAAMSPRTFARRFAEATGSTPHAWLLEQRLQRAEQLLEETDLPVDAVADRCGFGSGDTLRHHFARRRGTTPAAHRSAFGAR